MTFDFYEGGAGTGKTHNLVSRTEEIVREGALRDSCKLLALTFMNGARRRLDTRLGEKPAFRSRYECQTFDVFARMLATRRRSLISATMHEQAAGLSEFDGPCYLAAALLESASVREWVARSFPLVLVDEAQDLDEHRMRILKGLSQSCRVVAAADAFQCLQSGRDTSDLMEWLEAAGDVHRLTVPRRTQQRGLLAAAQAIRQGLDIKAVLRPNVFNGRTTWNGQGFRLLEAHATARNQGLLAWAISSDIAQREGPVAILTPDAKSAIVRGALEAVGSKQYTRQSGATFGPYPHTWERHEGEEVEALLSRVDVPDSASCAMLREVLTPIAGHPAIAQAIARMDNLRRRLGHAEFNASQVREFVQDAARDRSRLGFRDKNARRHSVMTIQRAKNREFPNVIVVWPHSATGTAEHMRRLLYNGITRAQKHCTVIVVGNGRMISSPFAP